MAISNKGSVWVWAGLAVSYLLFAAAPEAQGVSFIARRDFAAGSAPRSVAVAMGDFNGDGMPDLAVATRSGEVSVLLNNTRR